MTVIPFPHRGPLLLCRVCGRGMRPLVFPDQKTHPAEICDDESGYWERKFDEHRVEVSA